MAERITTGIPNFERLVKGGIPKGSTCLVEGEYGTGKTTFALQYILKGLIDHDEFGTLVSLVDDREDLLMDAKRFGWPLKRLEKTGTLNILDSSSVEKKSGGTIKKVLELVETKEADRLVIDGVDKFKELPEEEFDFKMGIHRIKGRLRELGTTTLLTADLDVGIEEIVDGVIILHYEGGGIEKTRAMEIRKMRRTGHTDRLCPFEITSGGIDITGPPEKGK